MLFHDFGTWKEACEFLFYVLERWVVSWALIFFYYGGK